MSEQERLEGHLCFCGLRMSRNPHPDAGKPEHLLPVGASYVCVPCSSKAHQTANERKIAAEAQLAAAREDHQRLHKQFQRETLRTSELSVIVKRFIYLHHVRDGHPAERWTKECDLCVVLADAVALLAKPLNAPRVERRQDGWVVYGLPDDEGSGRWFATEPEARAASTTRPERATNEQA